MDIQIPGNDYIKDGYVFINRIGISKNLEEKIPIEDYDVVVGTYRNKLKNEIVLSGTKGSQSPYTNIYQIYLTHACEEYTIRLLETSSYYSFYISLIEISREFQLPIRLKTWTFSEEYSPQTEYPFDVSNSISLTHTEDLTSIVVTKNNEKTVLSINVFEWQVWRLLCVCAIIVGTWSFAYFLDAIVLIRLLFFGFGCLALYAVISQWLKKREIIYSDNYLSIHQSSTILINVPPIDCDDIKSITIEHDMERDQPAIFIHLKDNFYRIGHNMNFPDLAILRDELKNLIQNSQ
jgi:hypothetical protein